jgi:RHS repeat-associated protein
MINGSAWQDAASNIRWRPMGAGLHSLTYGNGRTLERSHDTSGRLTRVRVPGVLDNQLSYNAFDEITGIQRGFTPSLPSQSYGYDDLGRLTTVGGSLPANFAYDANSNRTSHQTLNGTSIYTVPSGSNRLGYISGPAGRARNHNTDAVGNWVGMSVNGVLTSYEYDGFNRLSRLSRPSDTQACFGTGECITLPGGETEYGYNGLGQRISKREFDASGQQTAFWRYGYLPGGQLSFETNPDNPGVPRYYIWLGSQLIGLIHEGERFAVHTDHLGRPEAVTNAAGTRVWHAENHAFERRVLSSSLPRGLNIGFPGQYWDAESGLFYNHFRTYDPHTGRYTQSDPIGLAGGLNTYAYVGGNPISYIDPLGLSARDVEVIRQRFHSTVNDMTRQGLRHPSPFINNQQRSWGRLTRDLVGDSKKMDCGEQTEYMNARLEEGEYDDRWTFYMDAAVGHAWGFARSSNPSDPVLWYDSRSNSFSVGEPCATCHGWFGRFGGSVHFP